MIGSIRRLVLGMSLFLSAALVLSPPALATTVEITRGVTWLNSQVQGDGTLAGEAVSLATPVQARAEALITLAGASIPSTSLGNLLAADSENSTESLARRTLTLRSAGRSTGDLLTVLVANQNPDGGFGGAMGYASNALDTAWALLALKGASGNAASSIPVALAYLQSVQGGSGAFAEGDEASLYVTAVALAALEAHASQYSLSDATGRSVAYLESRRDVSGVWAGSPWLTSVVYLALHDFIAAEPDASAVRNFLTGTQAADGSWEGGDPFVTALALRALAATWTVPTYPTLAHLQGQVVDAQTRLPLDGVAVTLSNGQTTLRISTVAGQFQFLNLSPGTYEFTLALADYGTLSMPVSLLSGQTLDLGILPMAKPQGATTGTVTGTVRDALNGQPLAGVRIAIEGQVLAAFSADDGSYLIAGVPAGTLTLTATKAGYTTVSGSGQSTAGGQLLFSPVLAFGLESDTAIQGRVTHAVTGEPLAGVTLTVTGANALSTLTDSQGQYRLGNLASGVVTVTASLGGFTDVTFSGTLQGGSTVFFSPALSPVGTPIDPTKVSGTVRDAATDGPLDGVSVTSGGTTVTTGTDGRFLVAKSNSISFAKTGYIGGTLTFESASAALSGAQDLGDIRLLRKDFQGALLPDLLVQGIDTSALVVDPQNLWAEGIVKVSVANFGQTATAAEARVALYEDTDSDGKAGSTDRILGSAALPASLAPDGQAVLVAIEVGRFERKFRNSRLIAVVDEGQAVAEVRETNNLAFSSCLKPFPFVDDFNDGVFDGWTGIGGSPTGRHIENGILVANGGNSSVWTGDRNWTDYTAEVRLRFPNGASNDAGLQVRHLGTAIHSAYQLRIKANHARIIYQGNTINEAPFTVETNRWYQMRMDVSGKSLRAYIDNQLLFARDDLQISQGAVGLQEDGVLAQYDDLRVFGPASPGPADVSASSLRIVDLGGGGTELRVRIGNGGGLPVPAGTKIAFFSGVPEAGGSLLGILALQNPIQPGAHEDLSLALPLGLGGASEIVAIADHDGTPGTLVECDKTNNRIAASLDANNVTPSFLFGLQTDRGVYPANTPVAITAPVTNAGNYPGTVQVRFDIETANASEPVASLSAAGPATLQPGQTLELPANWNTATYLAGDYAAVATFLDAEGRELAQKRILIVIEASCGGAGASEACSSTGLEATLALDKTDYAPSDAVRITGRLFNPSNNQILDNLNLEERVLPPDGAELYRTSQAIAQLADGLYAERRFAFPLAGAAPGIYRVEQTVTDGLGAVIDRKIAEFRVQSSALTGFGLLGTLEASPETVPAGGEANLSHSVTNRGNALLTGLEVIVRVLDPAAGILLGEWSQVVDLPQGGVYSDVQPFATGGLSSETVYVAALYAVVGGQERLLAQDTFRVGAPVVRLEADAATTGPGRLLVLADCGGNEACPEAQDLNSTPADCDRAAGDPAYAVLCAAERRRQIRRVLDELGVSYRMVTDEAAFRREFRSGAYDTYWLSGGREKLFDVLAEEIREAVYRGDGLIVDGQHDERNLIVDEVTGIRFRGRYAALGPAGRFTAAPFEVQTLPILGRALKLDLLGGEAAAALPSGAPAAVRRGFGAGRSLLFAFDLAETLAADSSHNAWRDVLGKALADVRPAPLSTYTAGAQARLHLTVHNPATVEAGGEFTLTLPQGATLADSNPALTSVSENIWRWSFELPANGESRLDLSLRLPETDGVHALTGSLRERFGGTWNPVGDYRWEFVVEGAESSIGAQRAALDAYLPATPKEAGRQAQALDALDAALSQALQGAWDEAIRQGVRSGEALTQLGSPEVPGWRRHLARLLQEYAARAFQAEMPAP